MWADIETDAASGKLGCTGTNPGSSWAEGDGTTGEALAASSTSAEASVVADTGVSENATSDAGLVGDG